MSYQVLARKWRPKSFSEVIGQDHVLRVLTNALNQNKIHQAYLFTGTRGVGKTTIGRILAKCFNCEMGMSATPCCKCDTCLEIDACRFADLIEIDAASRTKVEDIREILNNVQYAPSVGRYKIYLIDEVHMLSLHSFNALLKTLEEPPPHVKFFLATTDKQKLPITILSRCLQFNLKIVPKEEIKQHLKTILELEGVSYDEAALSQLASAACGSVRDSLSLLDQAIAFGNNEVRLDDVNVMLGTVEYGKLFKLLDALVTKNVSLIFSIISEFEKIAADFCLILDELLSLLHKTAILQALPSLEDESFENLDAIKYFAKQIPREDVQLYYQIGVLGKRDLSLAPNLRVGFEMTMLRMLSFCPVTLKDEEVVAFSNNKKDKQVITSDINYSKEDCVCGNVKKSDVISCDIQTSSSILDINERGQQHIEPKKCDTDKTKFPSSKDEWLNVLKSLKLSGTTQAVIRHCDVGGFSQNTLELLLEPAQTPLLNIKHEERLTAACSEFLNQKINVVISIGTKDMDTPSNAAKKKDEIAMKSVEQDDNVKTLVSVFGAKIVKNDFVDV